MDPLGGSRPDWQILTDVANRLGANWTYKHPSEIYEEIASLTPIMAGVTYERLEGFKSLHWPVAPDGSDEPLLYTEEFNTADGKATFFPVPWTEPSNQPDEEYDLHLNNGRLLEHFHEGNMTYRSEGISEKVPCTFVEVSPELASARGIQTGAWVRLASRFGAVKAQAVVTTRVSGNELYMPMNSSLEPVNRLTSSCTDKVTHTPAYKETSVHLTVLSQNGENPLPRTNPRYGHPTPQAGVEVERKWVRSDYNLPGNGLVQIDTHAALPAQEK
jgi:formate dehydrogenase major subunit